MGIKAVIFDIGGVLLTLGEWTYRKEVAQLLGHEDLPETYAEQMPALQRGEIVEQELFEAIAGRPVNMADFDDSFRRYFKPVASMLAFAAELRAQGIQTAILSNTQDSHVRIMRGMNFLGGFEPIIMSCEAGVRKPEERAFHHVLNLLSLPPEAVAYIDDLLPFVEAGRSVGLKAVQHTGDVEATRQTILAML